MGEDLKKRSLQALTLSGWYNFFEIEVVNLELRRSCANLRESTPAGYSDPKSWDPEDQDEMDEIFYGYGTDLVMCTSGLWLYFILIPT